MLRKRILNTLRRILHRGGYVIVPSRSLDRLADCIDARINFGTEIGSTFHELSDDDLDERLIEAMNALANQSRIEH